MRVQKLIADLRATRALIDKAIAEVELASSHTEDLRSRLGDRPMVAPNARVVRRRRADILWLNMTPVLCRTQPLAGVPTEEGLRRRQQSRRE